MDEDGGNSSLLEDLVITVPGYENLDEELNSLFGRKYISNVENLRQSVDEESLIASVKRRSILWDRRDPEFKNQRLRQKLWSDVAKELNVDPQKIGWLKRKWETIKAAHVLSPPDSNKNAHILKFLDEVYVPRNNEFMYYKNLTACFPSAEEITGDQNPVINGGAVTGQPSGSNLDEAKGVSSILRLEEAVTDMLSDKNAEQKFGEYIAAELQNTPERFRAEAKLKVLQTLMDVQEKATSIIN